jgi:enterochelin esterase-like enzyme
VVFRTFDSKKVGVKISFHAYIPDTYNKIPDRLPVLYWLHGTEGGVSGIPVLARFFDEAMTIGNMPAMLVVFVNGLPRRLWADSKDGSSPVETVFITELVPHVDQTFRTISSREGRILEGFSMGGYGAARLGFKYPHLFAGISILAGGPFDLTLEGPRAQRNPRLREQLLRDVCSNDMDYFKSISPWMLAETAAVSLRTKPALIRQAVGSLDNTRELSHQFHIRMRNLAIAHEYLEYPNIDHDALALLEVLARTNGDFYYRALGRTQTSPKVP